MNKKGSYEMADLAGFVLIFITFIIFGYIFIGSSPGSKIEIVKEDYRTYEAKYDLLNFLNYEADGKNIADWIVLGVKNNDLSFIEEKSKKIFVEREHENINYNLYVSKDNKVLLDKNFKFGIDPRYISESVAGIILENMYEGRIYVRLSSKKYFESGDYQ